MRKPTVLLGLIEKALAETASSDPSRATKTERAALAAVKELRTDLRSALSALAETERLREVLKKIDSFGLNHTSRYCQRIARAALQSGEVER